MSISASTEFAPKNPAETIIEEWRTVPGLLGYRVSNLGRVQTRHERGRRGCLAKLWRDMKPKRLKSGHLCVLFSVKSQKTFMYVHRLVLEVFVGKCPENMECCHEDDNPANNRVTNLRWDTHRNNIKQASQRNRMARGRTNGLMKLTDEKVREIHLLAKESFAQRRIAAWFRISQQAVSKIVRGERWLSIFNDVLAKKIARETG